jgi:putative DNA primase/helicase
VIDRLYKNAEKHIIEQQREQDPESETDNPEIVAREVLAVHKHLVNAKNQIFYMFHDTHWIPLQPNTIKKFIYGAAKRSDVKSGGLYSAAENTLTALTAVEADVFRFESSLPSVINTKSKEVWLHRKTAEVRAIKHKPKSYLTTCLDVEYNPSKTCELFDRTLDEIFESNTDLIRHWWEFLGYVIQPIKNIPAWFMWHGSGANGKSLLRETMQALLGKAYIPRPVHSLGEKNDKHAHDALVGKLLVVDDDADVNTELPASALKKLAETQTLLADPKFGTPYNFTCTATPLVLINDWPMLKDITDGMLRKSYVIPFRRTFLDHEQDLELIHKIRKTEIPGILNSAIAGLQRLRQRDGFAEPSCCISAKKEWLRVANPLYDYANDQLDPSLEGGKKIELTLAYKTYKTWCKQGGIRFPLRLQKFEQMLRHLKYNITPSKGGKVVTR